MEVLLALFVLVAIVVFVVFWMTILAASLFRDERRKPKEQIVYSPPIVKVWQAHAWVCSGCGAKNFADNILIEMDEENKKFIRSQVPGIPEECLVTSYWSMIPKEVECSHCKTRAEAWS